MSPVCFDRLDEFTEEDEKAEFPAQAPPSPAFGTAVVCPTMPRCPQWATPGVQASQWTVAQSAPTVLAYSDPYTLLYQMRQTEIVHAHMHALLMHQLAQYEALTPLTSHIPVAIPMPVSDSVTCAKPAGKRGDCLRRHSECKRKYVNVPASTSAQGSLHPCMFQRLQPRSVMHRCAVRRTCLMLRTRLFFPGTQISRKREGKRTSDERAESLSAKKAKKYHPPSSSASSVAIPSRLDHGKWDTKKEDAPRNHECPTSRPLDGERTSTASMNASAASAASSASTAASTASTASTASAAASCSKTTKSASSLGSALKKDFVPEVECRYEARHADLDSEIQQSISSIMAALEKDSDEEDSDEDGNEISIYISIYLHIYIICCAMKSISILSIYLYIYAYVYICVYIYNVECMYVYI